MGYAMMLYVAFYLSIERSCLFLYYGCTYLLGSLYYIVMTIRERERDLYQRIPISGQTQRSTRATRAQ